MKIWKPFSFNKVTFKWMKSLVSMLSYYLICNYWVYYVVFAKFISLFEVSCLLFQKFYSSISEGLHFYFNGYICINTFYSVLNFLFIYSFPQFKYYHLTLIYYLYNSEWSYSKFFLFSLLTYFLVSFFLLYQNIWYLHIILQPMKLFFF